MQTEVMLITTPAMNGTFPSVCRQVLGYSPLDAVDAVSREMSEAEKFISCLAAFHDQSAPAGFTPNLLSHVSFSIFLVADERDMRDILECCSGMAFVTAETLVRSALAVVITGTLAQWRDAVVSGCTPKVEAIVRFSFNRIRTLFRGTGLDVWGDYRTREVPDGTLLLEYKPR